MLPITTRTSSDLLSSTMAGHAQAIIDSSDYVTGSAFPALYHLLNCQGIVFTTGLGKAGLIAEKVSATLRSTGTRSIFIHPVEALHGDIGNITKSDIVLAFSNSGHTAEILELLKHCTCATIAITGSNSSPINDLATHSIVYGRVKEQYPTLSTTIMLVVGDAIANYLAINKKFTDDDFLKNHPSGNLGLILATVNDKMRPLAKCHVVHQDSTIKAAYCSANVGSRRSGAIIVIDDSGALCGLFTDSDLARILENSSYNLLDLPIRDSMTISPVTTVSGTRLTDVIDVMADHKFSEVPVVDKTGMPIGLLDITDLISQL